MDNPIDIMDRPVNVVDAKLAEAHAIADLLYTLAATDTSGVGMETLSAGTIAEAMSVVLCRIAEARAAARQCHSN